MNIVVVGSGRVATHLAKAIHSTGHHHIVAIFSRSIENAQSLADEVDAKAFSLDCMPKGVAELADNDDTLFLEFLRQVDLILFSVKDSALESMASLFSSYTSPDAIYAHTAGSIPMNVFKNIASHYGVFYPLQTFSKERELNFLQIPCFIEGDSQTTTDVLMSLAESISDDVCLCDSKKREQLHVAAVFGCNFVNACYSIAYNLLSDCGLSAELVRPLLEETFNKIKTMHPDAAQTGPAVRWDENVMNHHFDMLQSQPLLQRIYQDMSEYIHKRSESSR